MARRLPIELFLAALVVVWLWIRAPEVAGEGTSGPSEAAVAAIAACADCHDLSGPGYARNPHLAIHRDPSMAAAYGVTTSCEGCHGDGTAHIESGGDVELIDRFGADVPAAVSIERCLDCHGDAHPRYVATAHAQAGLACTDCHSIHADGRPGLLTPPTDAFGVELAAEVGRSSASCFECHSATATEFAFNERHRLEEGILACVDCHSPHEPQARIRLGGFKQDTCTTCHVDQGGPFVFEHGAQRIDGCVACHAPHGSPNRHMLQFQSVADNCYSCHAAVPGFHTRFDNTTICTNCHVTIHGSNFHAGFLR